MQAKILALVFLAVAAAIASECPKVPAFKFDISSMKGNWYLREETPQSWFFPYKCTKNTYGPIHSAGASNPVSKHWRFEWFPFSLFTFTTNYLDVSNDTTQGNFTEEKQSWFHSNTIYQVLGGDSDTYAVLYTCSSHLFGIKERIQVLSNSTSDLTAALTNIDAALKKVNITRASLATHDQSCW